MTGYILAADHTDYTHIAQPGDVCQICHVAFWPGEVVTAVCSGNTIGLHCADVEGCLERYHEFSTGAHADGRETPIAPAPGPLATGRLSYGAPVHLATPPAANGR